MNEAVAAGKADLLARGFCVIEDILDPLDVRELRDRVYALAREEVLAGESWFSNGNQRIFMLLNKGQQFVRLAEHPGALDLVGSLLGPDFLLSSITANIANPGNVPQALHADQQYVPPPWPYPLAVQVAWMIDDFTASNGATRIVDGSHARGDAAPPDYDGPFVFATGRAGSLLCLDGRTWHGTGIHSGTAESRAGIFAYYCAPYIRQQENVFRSLRPDVRQDLSPRMRELLGFTIWNGLGGVDGLPREWIGRSSRSGPTNRDRIFEEESAETTSD